MFGQWANSDNFQLPSDLDTWRIPGRTNEAEEKIWQDLDQVFRDRGYILWSYSFASILVTPGRTYPLASGFAYATPSRGINNEKNPVGTVRRLMRFEYIVWSFLSVAVVVHSDMFLQHRILSPELPALQMATTLLYVSSF